MKTIKTRNTVKGIKALDKSVNLSSRMKDAFIRTKERAEETQNPRHDSPTDYASGNIQDTAQSAVQETVQHFPNAPKKARENLERAKNHFQEVKNQTPKERGRVADEAQITAHKANTNAEKLQKTAEKAKDTAQEAKQAVRDAKQELKNVRQSGRQTIWEVKQGAKFERDIKTVDNLPKGDKLPQNTQNINPARERFIKSRQYKIKMRGTVNSELPRSQSGVSDVTPKGVDMPSNPVNANPARDSFIENRQIKTYKVKNGEIHRANPGKTDIIPKSGGNAPNSTANVNPVREKFIKSRQYKIKTRSTVKSEMPRTQSGVSDITPKNADMPSNPVNANPARDSVIKNKQIKTGEIPRVNSNAAPKSSVKPSNTGIKPTNTTPPGNTPKGGISRPGYLNKGVTAHENVGDTAKTLDKSVKTVKSTKKGFKETAKGTVKTAKKSVKTAEKTAKQAVKTAKRTAKTAQKSAQTAVKSAKMAERTTRAAAKAAAHAAKAATKAVIAMVKMAIATIKGLVSLIIAGGWIAVAVILIICLIGLLVGSVFGIFFSSEPDPASGKTVNSVISEINTEYTDKIDDIINSNAHDLLDMSGARAGWKQVLAVYTVKTVTDPDNPMEVATMTDEKADILRAVFWDMNTITHTTGTVAVNEDVLGADGLPAGETTTVNITVLRITVTHKTTDEMATHYGFSIEQKEWLEELLKPDYHALWNGLLYGITSIGDGSMIEIADTQIGNVGGEPYWRWYGFDSRVAWCACFVSWCADQLGYIDAGIIPRFSLCTDGITWFKNRGQWQDGGYTPAPGDIIFFDWEPDGVCDHVGIVEKVEGEYVHTIEGNTSDSCARRSYLINSNKIEGYGIPAY